MSFLEAIIGAPEPTPDRRPLAEVQVATLTEVAARYAAPCPFKPGDLVTPRTGYFYRNTGFPHVVLEVADQPHRPFGAPTDNSPFAHAFGARLDVRVALIDRDGDLMAFWQESWRLEIWSKDKLPAPVAQRNSGASVQ